VIKQEEKEAINKQNMKSRNQDRMKEKDRKEGEKRNDK
jgi:hypothetical protein